MNESNVSIQLLIGCQNFTALRTNELQLLLVVSVFLVAIKKKLSAKLLSASDDITNEVFFSMVVAMFSQVFLVIEEHSALIALKVVSTSFRVIDFDVFLKFIFVTQKFSTMVASYFVLVFHMNSSDVEFH
jgi:hypothetical protein